MSHVLSSFVALRRLGFAVVIAACCLNGIANTSFADDDAVLTIGTKAPALDISHWVTNRNGKFEEVTEFEDDKVYVVEFWATWCGPCIASMPHLRETQDEYVKQGVQIVSISDEDLPTVVKFLTRKVRGEKKKLYHELTSGYCLTTDPDRSNHDAYMKASGQRGIPTCFIVGKDGYIEWIGHPMRMDKPLAQVVGDEWDREAFAESFKRDQAVELAFAKISRELWKLKKEESPKASLARLDEYVAELNEEDSELNKEIADRCSSIRFSLVMEIGGPEAAEAFAKMASESENPMQLNSMAWSIVAKVKRGDDVEPAMMKAACDAAKRGVELSKKEDNDSSTAAVLDTHANLLFLCDKLDDAIAVQKEAAELSDDEGIKAFLEKLLEAKEKSDA